MPESLTENDERTANELERKRHVLQPVRADGPRDRLREDRCVRQVAGRLGAAGPARQRVPRHRHRRRRRRGARHRHVGRRRVRRRRAVHDAHQRRLRRRVRRGDHVDEGVALREALKVARARGRRHDRLRRPVRHVRTRRDDRGLDRPGSRVRLALGHDARRRRAVAAGDDALRHEGRRRLRAPRSRTGPDRPGHLQLPLQGARSDERHGPRPERVGRPRRSSAARSTCARWRSSTPPTPARTATRRPPRSRSASARARRSSSPATTSPTSRRCSRQTKGTGVDVYTHGEMLPAHAYPGAARRTSNLVGHFGTAWQNQHKEFARVPRRHPDDHQLPHDPARRVQGPPLHQRARALPGRAAPDARRLLGGDREGARRAGLRVGHDRRRGHGRLRPQRRARRRPDRHRGGQERRDPPLLPGRRLRRRQARAATTTPSSSRRRRPTPSS